MAQTVEAAGECASASPDRRQPRPGVPPGGGGGIDVRTQHIAARQAAVDALQIGSGGATRSAQGGDHFPPQHRAVAALLGAEVATRRQADRRMDVVGAGVASADCALAVLQRQAGRAAAVKGCVDVDIVVGAQRELVGGPAHCCVHIDVARIRAVDVVGCDGDVVAAQIARQGVGPDAAGSEGSTACGHREVGGVDQPGAGATLGCERGDLGPIGHLHAVRAGLDEPTVATLGRTGIQRAGHLGGARGHARQQHDRAFVLLHRGGFNHAAVVDHAGQHAVARAGAQQHLAARSLDQPAVVGQRVELALLNLQPEQAAAAEVQADGAARTERHRAQLRADGALVDDLLAQQRYIAARCGRDSALVDHAGAAAAGKAPGATCQVAVGHVERGGHQGADVDLCIAPKQHAVGVDEPDLAVGVDAAQDLRTLGVVNAVDGDGRGRGLDEVDSLGRADVEALPVQRDVLAALRDGCGGAALADAGAAGGNLAALRCAVCRGTEQHEPEARRTEYGADHTGDHARLLAPPATGFGYGNPGLLHLAPYKTVMPVH